jgi:group I intron endonuclease
MENQRKVKDYSQGKIYRIVNSVNDKIYVGSTCSKLCKRMAQHRGSSNSKRDKDRKFYKAVNEIGVEYFRIILIKEFPCDNNNQLVSEEYKTMKELQENGVELYNEFIGCHSEETKQKIREAVQGENHYDCVGENNSFYGKQHTDESKQKMSNAKKDKYTGDKSPSFKGGCIRYCKINNNYYWMFQWKENKKPKSKSFPIKRYGEEEAKRLCEEYRKKIYPEYTGFTSGREADKDDDNNYVEIIFLD